MNQYLPKEGVVLNRLRWLPVLFVALFFAGCGTTGISGKGGGALSFLNTYDAALKDFERGHIMEARNRILAMDQTREDYPQAQKLLKEKVEPARLRLLRHYVGKAKEAEQGRRWDQAMRLYGHAAELSIEPDALHAKRTAMEMAMRQVRLDQLVKLRRSEDAAILKWPDNYEPPRGLEPKDAVFEDMREMNRDLLEDRADAAYAAARRYLRQGNMPEIAYVEAESVLRLAPDSERGKRLMDDVQKAFPPALRMPKADAISRPVVRRQQARITSEQVHEAMGRGDWVKARELARAYRREGNSDADALLKRVESGAASAAAAYFQRGRLAWQREQVDAAVENWQKAVELTPDNAEYAEALHRASQLQDRLRVLQEGNGK